MSCLRLVGALLCLMSTTSHAETTLYELHNHPNNAMGPPLYGLRLDGLLELGVYTFDFDLPGGGMSLEFDEATGHIRIHGRAYGGKDIGATWDTAQQGWVDIDFTYRAHCIRADNALGDWGDDLFVIKEDPQNSGTLTLDGWGGDRVFQLRDKSNSIDTFEFDNDWDHKQNAAFSADPRVFSGTGWLLVDGDAAASRDWSFWAEEHIGVAVDRTTWSAVKELFAR